jgi:HK97 family phage portal protein
MGDPLTISTIFRAVQILQTAITGLPLRQLRGNLEIPASPLVASPDPFSSRNDFISESIADLAINGNFFWQKILVSGRVEALRLLPASLVTVRATSNDPASPRPVYDYNGHTYPAKEIIHQKFLNVPGRLRGLGPIQSAREEIVGMRQAASYRSNWFNDGSNASGTLVTDQPLTDDVAAQIKERFETGEAGHVKVLGSGVKFNRLALSPADAQFLETSQFDTTQIARLMGVPASLLLAAVQGSSLTYSNIEQEWVQFADYTLAAYTLPLEDSFTSLVAHNNTVRFDWDATRRSNTKERYESYAIGIQAGFLTIDDVRKDLGKPELEPDTISQKEEQ